jgi:hypothetical protein
MATKIWQKNKDAILYKHRDKILNNYKGEDRDKFSEKSIFSPLIAPIIGEFGTYDSYVRYQRSQNRSILQPNRIGEQGYWLSSDREEKTMVWDTANEYNIRNGKVNRYKPFYQILDFYRWVENESQKREHEVKWMRGAIGLVKSLAENLEGGNNMIDSKLYELLFSLNYKIQNATLAYFKGLLYTRYASTPLQGWYAQGWDYSLIRYEQGVVASAVYNNAQPSAISKMNALVGAEGSNEYYYIFLTIANSRLWPDNVPNFSICKARVTDAQARIDIPMLMMYPNTYKPKWKGFKALLNSHGFLNDNEKARWEVAFHVD